VPVTKEEKEYALKNSYDPKVSLENFLEFDAESFQKYISHMSSENVDTFKFVPEYVFLLSPLQYKHEFLLNYMDLRNSYIFEQCNRPEGQPLAALSKTRIVSAKKMFFKNPLRMFREISGRSDTDGYLNTVLYFTKRGAKPFTADSLIPLEQAIDTKEIDNFIRENAQNRNFIELSLFAFSSYFILSSSKFSDSKDLNLSLETRFEKILNSFSYLIEKSEQKISPELSKILFSLFLDEKASIRIDVDIPSLFNADVLEKILLYQSDLARKVYRQYTPTFFKALDKNNIFEVVKKIRIDDRDFERFCEKIKQLNLSENEIEKVLDNSHLYNHIYYHSLLLSFYLYDVLNIKESENDKIIYLVDVITDEEMKNNIFLSEISEKIFTEFFSRNFSKDSDKVKKLSDRLYSLFFDKKTMQAKKIIGSIINNPETLYRFIIYLSIGNTRSSSKDKAANIISSLVNKYKVKVQFIHMIFKDKPEIDYFYDSLRNILSNVNVDNNSIAYILQNIEIPKDIYKSDILIDVFFHFSLKQKYLRAFNKSLVITRQVKQAIIDRIKKIKMTEVKFLDDLFARFSFSSFPDFLKEFISTDESLIERFIKSFRFDTYEVNEKIIEDIFSLLGFKYKLNLSEAETIWEKVKQEIFNISDRERKIVSCMRFLYKLFCQFASIDKPYLDKAFAEKIFYDVYYNLYLPIFSSSNDAFLQFVIALLNKSNIFKHEFDVFLEILLEIDKRIISTKKDFSKLVDVIYSNGATKEIFNDYFSSVVNYIFLSIIEQRNINSNYIKTLPENIQEKLKTIVEKTQQFYKKYAEILLPEHFQELQNRNLNRNMVEDESETNET